MRGRKPTPTHLKVLRGNPGKRKINTKEPKPKPVAPKCPKWMGPVGRKEWRRVVPELERLGLLTVVDGAALEGYCRAYEQWVEAEKFMREHGTIFKTEGGYIQQLPQVAIAQKYLQIVKSFCAEFGLTPSSRSRMNVTDEDDEDEMDAIIDGRR